MKTLKVNTRFMQGNKDLEGVIIDALIENCGHESVLMSDFDFDEAIYSDGFINAIEKGLKPTMNITESFNAKGNEEYHHVIINDTCYVMYFEN